MEDLQCKIECLRQRMNATALEKGISHPDVLAASQRLDEAINQLLKLARYSVY
ncbi:MAG: aspartyl-phosphate phosphatase Spo0E family protein [Sporomusaceae bacterium]|nr:aspartyl-phosphate phosphatase Spo0E family protein [Sporomusaceae bacterium]